MPVFDNTVLSSLAGWAQGWRRRRRRRVGERIMNDLPRHLQDDIGWEPPARNRRM